MRVSLPMVPARSREATLKGSLAFAILAASTLSTRADGPLPFRPKALRDASGAAVRALVKANAYADSYGPPLRLPDPVLNKADVTVTPQYGWCEMVRGPAPEGIGSMGYWADQTDHLLCFRTDRDSDMVFFAKSKFATKGGYYESDEDRGEFGFGAGGEVSIRLNPYPDSDWEHLEAGTTSAAFPASFGLPVEMMGLHFSSEGAPDMPLVVVGPPPERHMPPFDVLFYNEGQPGAAEMPDLYPDTVAACHLDNTQGSFMCRLQVGVEVRIVVICNDFNREPGTSITISEIKTVNEETQEVKIASVTAPWVSWVSQLSELTVAKLGVEMAQTKHFRISVTDPSQGKPTTHDVVLMEGDTQLPWVMEGRAPAWYRAAAKNLADAARGALGLYAAVLGLQAAGFTVASLAPLPVLSSALVSLQVVACIGLPEDAPDRFRVLAKPLEVLSDVRPVLAVLAATAALRVFAIVAHTFQNGAGSADNLPHGLSGYPLTGSWELRVLGLLALPLGLKAGNCIFQPRSVADPFYMFDILVGTIAAAFLLGWPAWALSQVRTWQREQVIVEVPLPGASGGESGRGWTDSMCDQLRSVPMNAFAAAGCSHQCISSGFFRRLFGGPSWTVQTTIAGIEDITHYFRAHASVWGRPGKTFEKTQDYGDDLTQAGAAEKQREEAENAGKQDAPKKGMKLMRADTDLNLGDSELGATGPTAVSRRVQAQLSPHFVPAMFAHPIRVTTKFVYMGGCFSKVLMAGVAGLPWLQAAVPMGLLPELERELEMIELRVCPGQLCGPKTAGRFRPLFDWCYRYPVYWPMDMAAKVLLGLYLALLEVTGSSPWWGLVHLSVAAICVGSGYLVFRFRPYTGLLDNLALLVTLATVALGALQYQLSHFVGPTANLFPAWMALLTALLVVVLAFMSLCVISTALLASCRDAEKVVQTGMPGWIPAADRETVMYDHAQSRAAQVEEAEQEERRSVTALVTFQSKVQLTLPARVRAPFQVRQVTLHNGKAAKIIGPTPLRVPVAASGLFAQKAYGMPVTQPFGVLELPEGASALYEASSLNDDGTEWEEVVDKKLRGNKTAISVAKKFLGEELKKTQESTGYLEGFYDEEMFAVKAVVE